RYNQAAPIFHARIEPRAWVEQAGGRGRAGAGRPFALAGGVCGLGHSPSLRKSIQALGGRPVDFCGVVRHQPHPPHELRRIAQHMHDVGATALVTTEKDSVNLCDDSEGLVNPLRIYWLKVSMAIDREEEFLAEIERRVGL